MAFTNVQVDLADLPTVASIVFLPLEQRYIRVRTVLTGALALLFAAIASLVVFGLLSEAWRPILIALVVLPMLPALAYISGKRCGYALREKDIALRKGIFWQRQIIQPLARIQHIELARGPIDKRLGLAGLRIFSAGTGTETLTIPGLDLGTAQDIRARLLDAQETEG